MTYREASRRLCSMGCEEILSRGPGSHRKWFNRSNGKATVIPDHGGKDLKLGHCELWFANSAWTGLSSNKRIDPGLTATCSYYLSSNNNLKVNPAEPSVVWRRGPAVTQNAFSLPISACPGA